MIASSRSLKALSLLAAAGLHVGLFGKFAPQQATEMESNAGAAEAMLGANFADMSAGTLTPTEVEEVTEATPPDAIEPLTSAQPAQDVPPPVDLTPVEPTRAESTQAALTPSVAPEAIPVLPPTKPVEPLKPELEIVKAQPVRPDTPSPDVTAAKPVTDVIAAAPDDPAARSPRPKRRDPVKAAAAATPKPKAPEKVAQKRAPKATAETGRVNNRQGSATGTETATAKAQGTASGRASESGNAAVSNYPGTVMRRIARVRKPNVRTSGVAVIAFAVASNGGLAKLSVARSSGSAALDQAALGVIRKAAPFPSPPQGARRSFSIKIQGR